MESIFANVGSLGNENELRSADNEFVDNYEAKVKALIADAVDYNDSDLSPAREENLLYFYGEKPYVQSEKEIDYAAGDYEPSGNNKSDAVSTDVRDTVMSVLPSLMRIFTSSENIVNFVPRDQTQVGLAKQATNDILYTFWEENNGFLLLHNIFKDAMTEKIGVVKFGTTDDKEVRIKTFRNISTEQLMLVIQDYQTKADNGDVEVLEVEYKDGDQQQVAYAKLRYYNSVPRQFVEAVAPEDFRIDRRATCVQKAKLVGSSCLLSASDVIEKGYSKELVEQYTGSYDYYKVERLIRNPGIDTSVIDRDLVEYGEYFIRIDQDGDGIDELHLICTLGDGYDIISDEIVDYPQLAVFCGDPRPHTVVGDALADLTKDIQDIKTHLLRGSLDSINSSMFPDLVVNELMVNMDDVLADGVGRVIRTKGDPSNTAKELRSSFIGEQVFAMMAQMDLVRQSRTGISEASKGVDPKALQSTNLMGIETIVTGAQERIELIARIFAETGFKDLMKGLLREAVTNPNPGRTYEINGSWVQVDQSLFDENMRARVNPNLGRGNDTTRMMALQQVRETQTMVMQTMGMVNPLVSIEQYQNTLQDQLAMVNIKDMDRYFTRVTPEIMQSLSGPKEPSPEDKIATAELEKVKKDIIIATSRAQIDQERLEFDREKAKMEDEFQRDKLGLTTLVNLTKVIGDIRTSAEVAESGVSAR